MNELFRKFCQTNEPGCKVEISHECLSFENTSGDRFYIPVHELRPFIKKWIADYEAIEKTVVSVKQGLGKHGEDPMVYCEDAYREVMKHFFDTPEFSAVRPLMRSQTRSFLFALSKYVGFMTESNNCTTSDPLLLDKERLLEAL